MRKVQLHRTYQLTERGREYFITASVGKKHATGTVVNRVDALEALLQSANISIANGALQDISDEELRKLA